MEYSKANKTLVLTLLEYYKTNQSKEFYELIGKITQIKDLNNPFISKLKVNDNNKEIIITNPDTINSRITDYYKTKFE